jgi:hypothetical protein
MQSQSVNPSGRDVFVATRLNTTEAEELQRRAQAEDRPVAGILRQAIRLYLRMHAA